MINRIILVLFLILSSVSPANAKSDAIEYQIENVPDISSIMQKDDNMFAIVGFTEDYYGKEVFGKLLKLDIKSGKVKCTNFDTAFDSDSGFDTKPCISVKKGKDGFYVLNVVTKFEYFDARTIEFLKKNNFVKVNRPGFAGGSNS